MEKSKKIVIITGSPRKNGNSFALVEAFTKEVQRNGHSITRYDAADMTIKGCTACEACFKTGKACSFDDDFNKIAPAIEEADAIVFATPLYWFTFPAKMKAVIDKFYAFLLGERGIGNKYCALIACCGDNDLPIFDGIRFSYKQTIDLLQWKSVGEVLVPSVGAPGDILKTDGIEQTIALADMF
jgi:multimeric flavodoxin WrbA